MPEQPTPAPTGAAPPPPAPPTPSIPELERLKVIIRPWPKVIFLYPTLLAAVVCWVILIIGGEPESMQGVLTAATEANAETGAAAVPEDRSNVGNVFMLIFFLNLLVFSFDFSRIKSITIFVAIVATGFALAWADTRWNVTGGIMETVSKINMQMNTQFYGWMSGFLFVCLLLVLINTRFNYYEINHREIMHHHGYLGDIHRVPTQGLRFNKEIYDLVEFALLRSGRLLFVTPTSHEAIVIDNVPNVNKVEDQIKDLLSVVAVRMG